MSEKESNDRGSSSTAPALGTAPTSDSTAIKARSGGRRRSCNRCSSKKERCDGREPCQRCARSGLECLYATCRTLGRPRGNSSPPTKRLPTASPKAKGSTTKKRAEITAGSGADAGLCTATVVKTKTGAARARNASAASATTGVAKLSLKRSPLSASPATGLKGLVENVYLTSFMDDFASYFRVLDDATVRMGLINLMADRIDPVLVIHSGGVLSPPAKRGAKKGCGSGSGNGGRGGGGAGGGRGDASCGSRSAPSSRAFPSPATGRSRQSPRQTSLDHDMYAINSAVFSAMALGALFVGQQPQHVEQYVRVAKASLRLCDAEMGPVPNERVATAHLLLAFAANVAGQDEYREHMQLTREYYKQRSRRGLPTATPITQVLEYRNIIDALYKPAGPNRIPAPKSFDTSGDGAEERGIETAAAAGDATPHCQTEAPSAEFTRSSNGRRSGDQGGPSAADRAGSAASASGGARGAAASVTGTAGDQRGSAGEHARLAPRTQFPPGLEAARQRAQRREAEPLLMVCDIMTVLSTVPWAMKENAARTRQQLSELRTLMAAERSLSEERRAARGRYANATDWLSDYTLNSALIGLHCALDEFGELLALGRGLAKCVKSCPGLARYNVHIYHTALAVLRVFSKRDEFTALVCAVSTELRVATPSGELLTFDDNADMCAMPMCVKYANAISEMGERSAANAVAEESTGAVIAEKMQTTSPPPPPSPDQSPHNEDRSSQAAGQMTPDLPVVDSTATPPLRFDEDASETPEPLRIELGPMDVDTWAPEDRVGGSAGVTNSSEIAEIASRGSQSQGARPWSGISEMSWSSTGATTAVTADELVPVVDTVTTTVGGGPACAARAFDGSCRDVRCDSSPHTMPPIAHHQSGVMDHTSEKASIAPPHWGPPLLPPPGDVDPRLGYGFCASAQRHVPGGSNGTESRGDRLPRTSRASQAPPVIKWEGVTYEDARAHDDTAAHEAERHGHRAPFHKEGSQKAGAMQSNASDVKPADTLTPRVWGCTTGPLRHSRGGGACGGGARISSPRARDHRPAWAWQSTCTPQSLPVGSCAAHIPSGASSFALNDSSVPHMVSTLVPAPAPPSAFVAASSSPHFPPSSTWLTPVASQRAATSVASQSVVTAPVIAVTHSAGFAGSSAGVAGASPGRGGQGDGSDPGDRGSRPSMADSEITAAAASTAADGGREAEDAIMTLWQIYGDGPE